MYEEPPSLPPRSEDFLEADVPTLPLRSPEVDEEAEKKEEEEEDDDKGVYEELGELAPPPPLEGQKSQPTVRPRSFDL